MSEITILPYHQSRYTCHFVSMSNYERFVGGGFGKSHIIQHVKYDADELYCRVDGQSGRCWKVVVRNTDYSTSMTYHIRDWIDIVHYYETEFSLSFIEKIE